MDDGAGDSRPVRVLFDALLLTSDHGGLVTAARELVSSWAQSTTDELHVVVPRHVEPWSHGVRWHRLRAVSKLQGMAAQHVALPSIARRERVDAVVRLNPIVTLRSVAPVTAAIVPDLRHRVRPGDFTRAQRAYRRLVWGHAFARATVLLPISRFTASSMSPPQGNSIVVVHLGCDHVDRWQASGGPEVFPYALHLAHRSNKGLPHCLSAWRAYCESEGTEAVDLKVVGLAADEAEEVRRWARRVGLEQKLTILPELPDDRFARVFAGASALLYPSEFEGYGLPVLEAVRLGIPVVSTDVPAAVECGAEVRVVPLPGWPSVAASALSDVLRSPPNAAELRRSVDHVTWDAAVRTIRGAIVEAFSTNA